MMKNGQTDILEVLEAFLLGLSCLVGGDQFYVILSQTGASVKTIYYVMIALVLVTLLIAMYFDYHCDLFFNGTHCVYIALLEFLVIFAQQRLRSRFFITLLLLVIGPVLTFLVIQSAARYTKSRTTLLAFVLGLFGARLLPTVAWFLVRRRVFDYQQQLNAASLSLGIARIAICLLSLVLKIVHGSFGISYKPISRLVGVPSEVCEFVGATIFWNFFRKIRICIIPFCVFVSAIALYLTFPPTMLTSHFNFSSRLVGSLCAAEMSFHLLGGSFGIVFPASLTGNDSGFYFVCILFFTFYVAALLMVRYFGDRFSHYFLYIIVTVSGFSLGYLWSFCLGIVFNTTLSPNCVQKEFWPDACCCDRFSSECYCRYTKILEDVNKYFKKPAMGMFHCLKSVGAHSMLSYSPKGCSAIIICVGDPKKLSGLMKETHAACSTPNSFKLVGVYILESVTTSTCENCQLTVRIEATKSRFSNTLITTPGSSDSYTPSCSNVKCCDSCKIDPNTCGCLKFCCGRNLCACSDTKCTGCHGPLGCSNKPCCNKCRTLPGKCTCSTLHTNCPCKIDPNLFGTRVFICYKSSGLNVIKEITVTTPEYEDDSSVQNEFNITEISVSDCCHHDLSVDLNCRMKNNFFRLTSIDYKNKNVRPSSLTFGSKCDQCKEAKENECPCRNSPFVKVSLEYPSPSDEELPKKPKKRYEICNCTEKCQSKCQCCKKGGVDVKCCCCSTCRLRVDEMSSFFMRVDAVRVKLVCTGIYFITITSIVVVAIIFYMRNKIVGNSIFSATAPFEKLKEIVASRSYNSKAHVDTRLKYMMEVLKNDTKIENDMHKMMTKLAGVLDPNVLDAVNQEVSSDTNTLARSFDRGNSLMKIRWCCITGYMFAYIKFVFDVIQRFFAHWEKIWICEYMDYRRLLSPIINKISNRSKFALSHLSELKITEQALNMINRTRVITWNQVLDELKRYTNLYQEESRLTGTDFPLRIDLRLRYYIDRWNHRVDHIGRWTTTNRSVFNWNPFLYHFEEIKEWSKTFKRHITRFSKIVNLPASEVNQGTAIFSDYKLN